MQSKKQIENQANRLRKFEIHSKELQSLLLAFLSDKLRQKDFPTISDSCGDSVQGFHVLAIFAVAGYARPVCEALWEYRQVHNFHKVLSFLGHEKLSQNTPFLLAHFEESGLKGLSPVSASVAVRFAASMRQNEDAFLQMSREVVQAKSQT